MPECSYNMFKLEYLMKSRYKNIIFYFKEASILFLRLNKLNIEELTYLIFEIRFYNILLTLMFEYLQKLYVMRFSENFYHGK